MSTKELLIELEVVLAKLVAAATADRRASLLTDGGILGKISA
jgi:hypothetical protein